MAQNKKQPNNFILIAILALALIVVLIYYFWYAIAAFLVPIESEGPNFFVSPPPAKVDLKIKNEILFQVDGLKQYPANGAWPLGPVVVDAGRGNPFIKAKAKTE